MHLNEVFCYAQTKKNLSKTGAPSPQKCLEEKKYVYVVH